MSQVLTGSHGVMGGSLYFLISDLAQVPLLLMARVWAPFHARTAQLSGVLSTSLWIQPPVKSQFGFYGLLGLGVSSCRGEVS